MLQIANYCAFASVCIGVAVSLLAISFLGAMEDKELLDNCNKFSGNDGFFFSEECTNVSSN